MRRYFTTYNNQKVPQIKGGLGGGKGGGGGYSEDPNTLFSTDILFLLTALGEGPVYRVNPNGPQDIEITENSIDDLVKLDGDGSENTDVFKTLSRTGTTTQSVLRKFGQQTVTPQTFSSPVTLKKGNVDGIPASKVLLQETSARAWDEISIILVVNALQRQDNNGNIKAHSLTVKVTFFDSTGSTQIGDPLTVTINGKTSTPYKRLVTFEIPEASKSENGYRFTIEKTSDESSDSRVTSNIQAVGWYEIENTPQTFPRTALVGYALKAINEHVGSIPTMSSLVKGLLVKVPSNYNQPILTDGQIDWRELELSETGSYGYTTNGYSLQKSGTATKLTDANPQIYVGTWDGTFVYSWTQNPVWIIYDILTNSTYGLGIPEDNIDKYKFYQVAQYCDACDAITGEFIGVDGQSDGSFTHKPRGTFTGVRKTLQGIPVGTAIKERRFICDILISDQKQTLEVLNSIAASFRGTLIHSFGKISLAVDQPDQLPTMLFNETNIKAGSFQISGGRESDIITGVDISYIEPTNHYKREVARIDTVDVNDGSDRSTIENIESLDLAGVTRRSQALRFAQYQIAASRYLRRVVSFTTSTDALNLAPGDVISISQNMTGINYGFGGKVTQNSSTDSGKSHVYLEHFTEPTLSNTTFTANTYPIALRVIKTDSDRVDLYILSNSTFTLTSTDNVSTGFDIANVTITGRYNPITKTVDSYSTFTSNNAPTKGDLWTIGEWENPGNFYTNKAGKLFTVAEIERETADEEVNIIAKEYVSNVYVDSDSFIDYTPTAYTDIESSFSPPPAPNFTLQKQVRRNLDGTIVFDAVIDNQTDRLGYQQGFSTEYFVSLPVASTLINNSSSSVLSLTVDNTSAISNGAITSTITGKNGFSSFAGEIKLLCNAYSEIDNGDGTSNVRLVVEGLNVIHDENFAKHVLEVNDGSFLGLKGDDRITVPLKEKTSVNSSRDFVAYANDLVAVSANIVTYNKSGDTIDIENTLTGALNLIDVLPAAPFYVTLNQLLDSRFYANNSFYVSGSMRQISLQGNLTVNAGESEYIDLPVRVRNIGEVRLYIDGVEQSTGQFSLNKNSTFKDNVQYTVGTSDITYRVELDHYTVPAIEVGDNLQAGAGNVFSVVNTSYDTTSATYNVQLTTNSIYRIQFADSPTSNLSSIAFVNVSPNPVGTINNVLANTCTFDYDETVYPGTFKLANSGVYDLQVNADYDRVFLNEDLTIKNLPQGRVSVKARNINPFKRTSPFVEKNITISPLPIQKVNNLDVRESLYREQNSGVAVRVTVLFDHINSQEVTDYEISYKLDSVDAVGTDDGGTDLTSFNTVKVPATGVDDDGKIRFTVNGINRGLSSQTNSVTFRVTPLNKNLRGSTSSISKSIVGKTAPPSNIFNFTGGQQTDQITLFWEYVRQNQELVDLDLKEVVIRRIQGIYSATLENFLAGSSYVTVAAGVNRKSIPIDIFGTFTYLVRTRDTSGNFSEGVVGITLTTARPKRTTVVAAYSEDSPPVDFSDITNSNSDEENFPSFANSNTGGLSYSSIDSPFDSSLVDNANGTSTGFSAIGGSPTDLLADGSGTYITQIRDFGSTITGQIAIDLLATQAIQTTYNDQHEHVVESTTEEGPVAGNVLVDSSFGGIGHIIGFANSTPLNFRYDANNMTRMSGSSSGNVYAIHMHGNFVNDESNANVFALIAGTINSNAIALGETFYANGDSTGSNVYANLAVAGSSYYLVNLKQYNDFGASETYAGSLGALSQQTFIRTTTSDNTTLYYSNGNVNLASFTGSEVNEGYIPYEAGSRTFRQFQIKFVVNNSQEDEYDFTIDQFRYTVEKEQTIFETTVTYNAEPTEVDYSTFGFLNRPRINIMPIDTATAQTALVTAGTNTSVSFKLYDVENNALVPTASAVQVQVTAIGV
jgi:hypothetical protein